MTVDTPYYKARDWQKRSFKKINRCLANDNCQIMPVNATVGSGKTDLACYAFGKFIEDSIESKTISIFVSPRVKLCKQQNDSIEKFISQHSDLKINQDYEIIAIDNTSQEFDRNGDLQAQHAIFVFCEASLWGSTSDEDADAAIRWNKWLGKLKHWTEDFGYSLGVIFYDEAHNYERKADKIMKLAEMFKLTMLASGTPAHYQKELSKKFRKNACECSPSEAMSQKMICKPSLSMIRGNADANFPYAIKAVLEREAEICSHEVFKPVILVNCNSIDQIKSILEHDWISSRMGKAFNIITIHSSKPYALENKCVMLDSNVNGKPLTSEQAYDAIEQLDKGYFKDLLPVIVFQVGMIGEGINVSSFNSVIITTHSDRTAMQQIGRAVRNCFKDGKSKVDDGHANVYAFFENIDDLRQLIINLQSYDLTDECFTWGKQIDICTGSGLEHNAENDAVTSLNDFKWSDIDAIDIEEILNAADLKFMKKKRIEFVDEFVEQNPDIVAELVDIMKTSGYDELLGCKLADSIKRCDASKIADEVKKLKDEHAKPALKDATRYEHKQQDVEQETQHVILTKDAIISMLITIQQYARTHKSTFKTMKDTLGLEHSLKHILGNDIIGSIFMKMMPSWFISKLVSR